MVNVARRQTKSFDINKRQSRFYDCMRSAKSFASKHKIITVIIIIILTFLIGRKLIAWQDYQKFKKAEVYISNIANNIAESNSPDSKEQSNYCYHQARVFVEGPLSCVVRSTIIHRNLTTEQANNTIQNTKKTLTDNGVKVSEPLGLFSYKEFYVQDIENNITTKYLDHCAIRFIYDSKSSYGDATGRSDLTTSVHCQAGARTHHYKHAD